MWNDLNMAQRNELIKLYLNNGISSLDKMKEHYNSYQDGGKITFQQWKAKMQAKYPDIEMDNAKAGYNYEEYFNNNYNDAIKQLVNLQHFPDTYKLPNHPTFSNESIYSRGPMMGGNWINDSTFNPSVINRKYHPNTYKEDRPYTEREIYVNEYQQGGKNDNISSGRWVQVDNETVTPEYSLPPVTIEAEHPLWSLPWYKDKKNNPNINRYKDQLYNNWRRHNETGKEYLKRVAGGLSVMALPIGGAAGFILGVPDLATDFVEMIDKPSVSNATELTLDAPTRYGTELDNALISVLESNRYTKPLAKILEYNDILQYIGAANDASTAITGKSIIEHASE